MSSSPPQSGPAAQSGSPPGGQQQRQTSSQQPTLQPLLTSPLPSTRRLSHQQHHRRSWQRLQSLETIADNSVEEDESTSSSTAVQESNTNTIPITLELIGGIKEVGQDEEPHAKKTPPLATSETVDKSIREEPAGEHEQGEDDRKEDTATKPFYTCTKTRAENGRLRVVVALPGILDAAQANDVADALFHEIDQLPSVGSVDHVRLDGLRFRSSSRISHDHEDATGSAVDGLKLFLNIHASSVRSVCFNNIVVSGIGGGGGDTGANTGVVLEEEDSLVSLIEAFANADLEAVDLSYNRIGPDVWKILLTQHTQLKHLILDCVGIDDASIRKLSRHLTLTSSSSAQSLEVLLVCTNQRLGPDGLRAADSLLEVCTKLKSLRWVNHHPAHIGDADETVGHLQLPWAGLHKIAHAKATLVHLVLGGDKVTAKDIEENRHICGTIGALSGLKTLKLRDLGLTDEGILRIVATLTISRPPLECFDISCNKIGSEGAQSIAELVKVDMFRNLKVLGLNNNNISFEGAMQVIESFSRHPASDLEIRFDGNPFNLGMVARKLAVSKAALETKVDQLRKETDRLHRESTGAKNRLTQTLTDQSTVLADVRVLRTQVTRLTEERDTLLKAFSIAGVSRQVQEQKVMIDRLRKLEELVLGEQVYEERMARSMPSSPQTPTKSTGIARTPSKSERKAARSHLGDDTPTPPELACNTTEQQQSPQRAASPMEQPSPAAADAAAAVAAAAVAAQRPASPTTFPSRSIHRTYSAGSDSTLGSSSSRISSTAVRRNVRRTSSSRRHRHHMTAGGTVEMNAPPMTGAPSSPVARASPPSREGRTRGIFRSRSDSGWDAFLRGAQPQKQMSTGRKTSKKPQSPSPTKRSASSSSVRQRQQLVPTVQPLYHEDTLKEAEDKSHQ